MTAKLLCKIYRRQSQRGLFHIDYLGKRVKEISRLLLVFINVSSKQDYYMEVKHGLYQGSY